MASDLGLQMTWRYSQGSSYIPFVKPIPIVHIYAPRDPISQIAGLVVNYGISNTIVLEIP